MAGLGPISPGPRLNGGTIAAGNYSPPLSLLYITTAGSLVVTAAQNSAVLNFGSVAAGTKIDFFAISNIGTATTAAGLIGW